MAYASVYKHNYATLMKIAKPRPLSTIRLRISGKQPKLERLFAERALIAQKEEDN